MRNQTIWDFEVRTPSGERESLSLYKGKVVLIVNTATECGFTPQYTGLEQLYQDYQARGFVILDFPCNQFGKQAPGTDAEIQSFCELNFFTTFPRYAKLEVNGPQADPLFKFLKASSHSLLGEAIKWNFTKFLIDREGQVVKRFAPNTAPNKLRSAIEALL